MKFQKLVDIYEALGATTKRLEKIDILAHFLKNVDEKDSEVLYLLTGRVFPEYSEEKIGISTQLVIKALSKSTGLSPENITKEWKKLGDLGEVSEKLSQKSKQKTLFSQAELTVKKVYENIKQLPELEGKGTVDKKMSLITEILNSASPTEAKYIVRILLEDLRIGIQDSTIREAMNLAFFDRTKEASEKLEAAFNKANDVAEVFLAAKKGKLHELDKISIEVGKPLKVMLAQKAKTVKEGFEAVGKPAAIEFKYDGFRMLIHKKGETITLFTRSLENVTKQFPEVVDYVKKYVKGESFIIDSEAVGFDKKTKKYQSFQHISQRIKRKYDIEKLQAELPVEVNVFDLIYLNGKSYLEEPFEKRSETVRKIIKDEKYKIVASKQLITDDEEKAEKFYKEALKDNQEGIMMKSLQSPYNPGSRVGHMLKIKPEERDLDLVIVGGEYGTGKRSGWLSSFVLACRDDKTGEFLEIGKMGTGIKEKTEEGVSFEELTEKIKPLITKEHGKEVKIKPKLVVSITYQEIQKSPSYSSGFALRFPRFTALRTDKPLSEVNSLADIEKDFEKQFNRNYKYG